MTRIPRLVFLGAVAAAFVSCSSDSDKTSVEDISTIDATVPSGETIPGGVDVPILTGDCQAVYAEFIRAMTSTFAPSGDLDYAQVFGNVTSAVPADLQDDMAILSAAFEAFGAILAANNNDMSNAEVQQAIQALGTPEVNAASTAVQAYFEEACPGVG